MKYKVEYAIFHSDSDNSHESSFAHELLSETDDYVSITKQISDSIAKSNSYRGFKIIRVTPIKEKEDEILRVEF